MNDDKIGASARRPIGGPPIVSIPIGAEVNATGLSPIFGSNDTNSPQRALVSVPGSTWIFDVKLNTQFSVVAGLAATSCLSILPRTLLSGVSEKFTE